MNADILHTAICQAVTLMNTTPGQFGTEAHNILRQALVDCAIAASAPQPRKARAKRTAPAKGYCHSIACACVGRPDQAECSNWSPL